MAPQLTREVPRAAGLGALGVNRGQFVKSKFGLFFLLLSAVAIFGNAVSAAPVESNNRSGKFTITGIKYRATPTGYTPDFDCSDCLLIEGSGIGYCGNGFVIQGAVYGSEDAKFFRAMIMMAYAASKQVDIGAADCIQWNGEWKAKVNRVYIY